MIKESCDFKSGSLAWFGAYGSSADGGVFYLSPNLTRPLHWGVMQIYGWELHEVYHFPEKFGDHKNSDSRDITFLICYMIFQDNAIKGLFDFVGGTPSH